MSKRYLARMSNRIASSANEIVGLWQAKYALVGNSAFDVGLDFNLATMVWYLLSKYALNQDVYPVSSDRILLVSKHHMLRTSSCSLNIMI